MTEGGSSSNASKGRLLILAAVVLLAAIIAIAVGLGVALYEHKRDHDQYVKCDDRQQTTTATPTTTLPYPVSESIEGKYKYAAVASDAGECSTVGSDIMARHGGSAVDAAIAAILCQCVVYPYSCGIGGGHFMVIYNRSQSTVQTIMARETAPAAATEDMFVNDTVSSTEGGLAIAVPGELAGLKKAWDIGGKLPWKDLFQPAIKLCNEGIRVSKPLAYAISSRERFYARNENLRKLVTNNVTGNLYREGEIIKRAAFGRTLQKIADEGPAAFYNGSLTKDIVQEIRDAGFLIFQLIQNMTSDDYARDIRSRIRDDRTFDTAYYEPTFFNEEDGGTSHLSVLAPNGDAVSITSTVNLYFGSKVVGSKTGIIYNDEMDDFSTPNRINYYGIRASPANFVKPGKRPLSSMSPAIVVGRDGKVRTVAIIETLWFDYGIKRAIDEKRIHHQLLPKEIHLEKGFPKYLMDGLKRKGHNITINDSAGSIVMGIKQDPQGHITANSDIRKYGRPDGY
ncbi:hypothetical protein KUTeg_009740 [Tegillarca granosa]|uniref:Gamma-glutamyltransferase n=1 Tax=Tegillarca granosa TaxID=220873 RepID=A0ABQ9F4S9_TEGGR|nr:hypothetical protein KUTeg_009740 [Tegillarca granosa]